MESWLPFRCVALGEQCLRQRGRNSRGLNPREQKWVSHFRECQNPAAVTSLARCTNTVIQNRVTFKADNAMPDSSKDRLPRDEGGDDDVCDP